VRETRQYFIAPAVSSAKQQQQQLETRKLTMFTDKVLGNAANAWRGNKKTMTATASGKNTSATDVRGPRLK